MLCAVAFLLFLAWKRTAILAGGIAVVRSGVGYVEDGDAVLDFVLWRLGYRPEEQKKTACLNQYIFPGCYEIFEKVSHK